MLATILLVLAAAVAWGLLFAPWAPEAIGFWPSISLSLGILVPVGLWLDRGRLRRRFRFHIGHLWLGIGSALILYLVFWLGHALSIRLLPGAAGEIGWVYDRRLGSDPWVIAGLLFFWIGPGEELFWRGVVQERLARRLGPGPAYGLATVLYTLVHLWAWNGMLLLAALCCGLLWGWLYQRTGSLWPGIISHALWDVVILVLLPLA